jgi:hypothetical protein
VVDVGNNRNIAKVGSLHEFFTLSALAELEETRIIGARDNSRIGQASQVWVTDDNPDIVRTSGSAS